MNFSYDYVALYDGTSESAPLIIQHCGQNLPVPNIFYSTGNKMFIRMKADGSVTSKGFSANYTTACGATITTSGSGDLMSPNYPNAWETGGDCTWTIVGSTQSMYFFCIIFTYFSTSLFLKRVNLRYNFCFC